MWGKEIFTAITNHVSTQHLVETEPILYANKIQVSGILFLCHDAIISFAELSLSFLLFNSKLLFPPLSCGHPGQTSTGALRGMLHRSSPACLQPGHRGSPVVPEPGCGRSSRGLSSTHGPDPSLPGSWLESRDTAVAQAVKHSPSRGGWHGPVARCPLDIPRASQGGEPRVLGGWRRPFP